MLKKMIFVSTVVFMIISNLFSSVNKKYLFRYKFKIGERYSAKLMFNISYLSGPSIMYKEKIEQDVVIKNIRVSLDQTNGTFVHDFKAGRIKSTNTMKCKPFKVKLRLSNRGDVIHVIDVPSLYPNFKNKYNPNLTFPDVPISTGFKWKSKITAYHFNEPAILNVIVKFVKLISYKNKTCALFHYWGKEYNVGVNSITANVVIRGMELFDFKEGKTLYKKVKLFYYVPLYHGGNPRFIVLFTYNLLN